MKRFKCSVLVYLFLLFPISQNAFNIIGLNKQMLYEYVGSVQVGAKAPQEEELPAPPTTGWIVRGKLTLQRQNNNTLAAALVIDDVTLNNSGEKFLQNKDMYPAYKPFKIALNPDGTISHLVFKETDPIWSTNFKRAIASMIQFQTKKSGAFVVDEMGIHGECLTEYFISNKTNYISIRKTPELSSCKPYAESIHVTRSNVPTNTCKFDFQQNVISGNEAIFGMLPHAETGYFLSMAHVKGSSLIHTFESTGEAQFINSELLLNFLNETSIDNPIDIETSMADEVSGLQLLQVDLNDPTGGRFPQQQENLINSASRLLDSLAEGLENSNYKFSEPYDSTVSDVIKLLTEMDYVSLKKLYTEVDIGTSYRQETIRNIFHEIIPRIGTKASVFLTRYLVVEKKEIKSTIAVQLIVSMPFHIFELSHDLIKGCEDFLNLGPERPDVMQAAVLSFATLVYNVHIAGGINKDVFEDYVQKYFNLYLDSRDYDSKMLYLQGLSNLQVGNVANYLDPIVSNGEENQDIKFLAAWTTLSLAPDRAERIYEIYWPIFESRNASLELRVAAVTLLLISNPTAARLISIHRIIQSETDPHMINYYRTTITSISETTYPCYQNLRRLLSYMHRHLPQKPEPRYWVTGNYIFDYRDSKFGIGAMLQALLVGDPKSDLPVVAYLQFDTEALGKFTGQLALYIKARGLPDTMFKTLMKTNGDPKKYINIQSLLKLLDAPIIDTKPLHLEFILKMEGKAVLSYYLNERTYQKITYKDLIDRIAFLIRADSHINMQTVRWPFMTKYAVPTVLGTNADVLLQTTVLTSLRGNITQFHHPNVMKSSLEIDARYSSYASCRSRSYNPFLNLDHEINREQGFLIYVPLYLSLNYYAGSCWEYAFNRPANLTSGLSFKSRSVTTTRGLITKSANEPFEEIMHPERHHDVVQLFKYDMEDLGMSIIINTNLNELNKYRGMLLKSEFMENGFSRNMIINFLMYVFGVAQLSSIHLGHDRNFTLLISNEKLTKIEGAICSTEELKSHDSIDRNINFTLIHTDDQNMEQNLHKWIVNMDVQSSKKTSWFNLAGNVQRTAAETADMPQTDWKACVNVTFAPLVFTKRPHTFMGTVIFGNASTDHECPANGSSIHFSSRAGPSDHAREFLLSDNPLTDTGFCPKEVLKFSPIPTSKYCKRSNFENFTSITKYDMDVQFDNMPEWYDFWSSRLDHFVSSFSSEKVERLNMNKEIHVSINAPNDYFWLTVEVNGVRRRIYHIPFIQKLDSKYDASHEISYDSGVKRSCSVINGMVNSFDDYLIDLSDYHKVTKAENCLTLLAADCSPLREMAVFLMPSVENSLSSNYGLRVYIGENYFTFKSSSYTDDKAPVNIILNKDEKVIDVRQQPYQYPEESNNYDFRIEVNEQNILIVENNLMHSTIQFDMLNILNFEIYSVYKNKMCGLCSKPLNSMRNYTLCE
ncbi:Vitellogenin-1 [Lucilia cuprina]|nr:Vitellogenin-1 [Lucilia cuprina]